MNVLIIGLGYAGNRYLQAFYSLEHEFLNTTFDYAYVSPTKKNTSLDYYGTIAQALQYHTPEIVVVSVSDGQHAEVLLALQGYSGFIICEKPLVSGGDDLTEITAALQHTRGFCMDMIERYSEVSRYLKKVIYEQHYQLIRAHFIWGKDRIHDHRSTCGALSEIIHPLDLILWVLAKNTSPIIDTVIAQTSDFSISGNQVVDSLAINARLDRSFISGYSSFVNIIRQRTIDLILSSPEQELIYARMTFDTPEWDMDHLKLWKHTKHGDQLIKQLTSCFPDTRSDLNTIQKLRQQLREILLFLIQGIIPEHDFVDLTASVRLQTILNTIEQKAQSIGSAQYVFKNQREFFTEQGGLEQLG